MKWQEGSWYSLCTQCFSRYKKEGNWCKLMQPPLKCSICGKPATREFYPHSTK